MTVCRKCRRPFKDEDEVAGVFLAFWHEVPSAVSISVSKPHDYIDGTFEHVNCEGE